MDHHHNQNDGSCVVVKGFGDKVTSEELQLVCSQLGPVEWTKICYDFTTGESKGEALVKYKNQKDAATAAACLNGCKLNESSDILSFTIASSLEHRVIVIGSGLAGLCAAFEAAQQGSTVLLLEKEPRFGGNSAKASSGVSCPMNDQDVPDFVKDTIKSGGGMADLKLVQELAFHGHECVFDFLKNKIGIPLPEVTQCGGHSAARTFRNLQTKEGEKPVPNVGWAIVSAVFNKLKEFPNFHYICGAEVVNLVLTSETKPGVKGVKVQMKNNPVSVTSNQQVLLELQAHAVVIATGGFSANKQLLQQYCPRVVDFPTTNGTSANGSGLLLCQKAGGMLVQMDQVQLHPTAFVDPADPDAQVKILAAEALRACGGVLLNHTGSRFINELSTRDAVVQGIISSCQRRRAFLVLSEDAARKFGAGLSFYAGRGLMKHYSSISDAASALNLPEDNIRKALADYNQAAQSKTADSFGRTVFASQFVLEASSGLWVGQIEPAVHYTMGGVAINHRAEVLQSSDLSTISGLYAAGEITGGLHGHNRLAGNSLAECLVFGRIAGRHASHFYPFAAALNPHKFVALHLQKVWPLSSSTQLFRFAFPSQNHQSGLGLGEFLCVRAFFPKRSPGDTSDKPVELEEVQRYYSPVSRSDEWGHIDLLIKTNTGGIMTDHLLALKPGDSLDFKGPVGGPNLSVGQYNKIAMLAGGTGIAPMIQIIRSHILQEIKMGNQPRYDLRLVYGCKNEEEILLRQILEKHAQKHPNIKLFYTLLEPPDDWKMGVGFVNKEVIETQFPPPSDDLLIIICGPPPFCTAMKKLLDSMNYSKDRHYYSYI